MDDQRSLSASQAFSSLFRTMLLSMGLIAGPMNSITAMSLGENERAVAIALLSLTAVQAAGQFGRRNG